MPHPTQDPADDAAARLPDAPSAFSSALVTEHFVLQTARGTTVSESSSRASMHPAMQRIRRWYGTILPGAGRYFPLPGTRAAPNELIDIGLRLSWRGVFSTLSSAIAGVNCIVAGAGAALAASSVTGPGGTVVTGVVTAAVLAVLHGLYQERRYARVLALLRQVESAPPHDAAQHP